MEICEAVSFYYSRVKYMRVKYVTLQELLANNMQSLIREISKHSRVIKNECPV